MKWNEEKWTDKDDRSVTLVRADGDGAVLVDGVGRDVKDNDLYVPSDNVDTVGVYSVNEDDLRKAGFSPVNGGTDSGSDDDGDSSDDGGDDSKPRRTVPRKRS